MPLLTVGYIYRAEFLAKPKHNVLAYDRTPKDYIILYDIQRGTGDFLSPIEMELEANRIELETVPYIPPIDPGLDDFKAMLQRTSILGGQLVEGITIKNYHRFGFDAKPLFGKYVSEKFKEVHAKEWKNQNPAGGDILDLLTARYRSEARWQKAVQHLTERGELEGSPRDIGKLFKEVPGGQGVKSLGNLLGLWVCVLCQVVNPVLDAGIVSLHPICVLDKVPHTPPSPPSS